MEQLFLAMMTLKGSNLKKINRKALKIKNLKAKMFGRMTHTFYMQFRNLSSLEKYISTVQTFISDEPVVCA